MKTKMIMVGGFLGAGKTTLLYEAAKKLQKRNGQVGLITNDQAAGLVDTAFLTAAASQVREVSGSCFCCNFDGLAGAIAYIQEKNGDGGFIIAEPVGSCTDLSATLLQPLKDKFDQRLEMAPLTVLADPYRISGILLGTASNIHPSAKYIIEKQLEEADVILINKSDLMDLEEISRLAAEKWKQAKVMTGSVLQDTGIDEWLDFVLEGGASGSHLAEVDYDVYAEGEAALGWLNAQFSLRGDQADWDALARGLMESLGGKFDSLRAAVGHVKILLESGGAAVIGNLTGRRDTVSLRQSAGKGGTAKLTVNARVEMDPDALEALVLAELQSACGDGVSFAVEEMKCLTPGRPQPTYRYDRVV